MSVFVMLLTAVVRVAWLAIFPVNPIAPVDAEGFHLLAVNVLAGRGFAIGWDPPFCPAVIRTPLYPFFVVASYLSLGNEPARAVLAQVLLEVVTTALVMRMGCDLGGRRAGLWAGLLYAINGTTQRYTGYLLSESLLLPLLTAAVLITLRCFRRPTRSRMSLAGFFWGLSLLTKPNIQFLALVIGVLMTIYEWRMANGISRITNHIPHFTFPIFWLVFIAVLFPWLARNRIVLGRWMLSTAFAENLARVGGVATLAEVEGLRVEPWTVTWEHLYDCFVADVGTRNGWPEIATVPDACAEVQRRQFQIARAARDFVLAHPFAYMRAHARGVLLSMANPGHGTWYRALTGRDWETTGVVDNMWARVAWSLDRNAVGDALRALWSERITHPPVPAALIWWGLVIARLAVWVLSVLGLWRLRSRRWARLTLALTVFYLVVLPGPIAYDRFYLPAIPVVVVWVALGIQSPVKRIKSDRLHNFFAFPRSVCGF